MGHICVEPYTGIYNKNPTYEPELPPLNFGYWAMCLISIRVSITSSLSSMRVRKIDSHENNQQ